MNINWVFGDKVNLDPTVDLATVKQIGSSWGSWKTWRQCQTDNVVCHDVKKANELVARNFQTLCNFYIPKSMFIELDRPQGVHLYEGDFVHDVDSREEIVAMHLVSGISDIVLLLGFDFSQKEISTDKLVEHKNKNYINLIKHVIADNSNTQWVLIDHHLPVVQEYKTLTNLTTDSLENVIKLLDN
jgi:hypothetical protein